MANGDITVPRSADSFTANLLDVSPTGAGVNGVWVDCGEYRTGTVATTGALTTTVVTINGSNAVAQPSPGTVGTIIDTTGAGADKFTSIPVLPRWIKASITIAGTGLVTAAFTARRN